MIKDPKVTPNKPTVFHKFKKKRVNKKQVEKQKVIDLEHVLVTKFLGYCDCNAIICSSELISVTQYVCPKCNKKGKIRFLRAQLEGRDEVSKKEYLNTTTHSIYTEKDLNDE